MNKEVAEFQISEEAIARLKDPYSFLAAKAAREAYDDYFHHRTGWYSEECPSIVQIYYDNNKNSKRDERLAAIVAMKEAQGVPLLARGEFPLEEDSKGYTIVLIFYSGGRELTP